MVGRTILASFKMWGVSHFFSDHKITEKCFEIDPCSQPKSETLKYSSYELYAREAHIEIEVCPGPFLIG